MFRERLILFTILFFSLLGFSQNPEQDSIAPKKAIPSPSLPIDSTFVTYSNFHLDSIFLNASKIVDTSIFEANVFEVLERNNEIVSTLSNTGLAHKSMRFNPIQPIGFDMSLPAYSKYIQNERNMISYQSVLPYSEVRYVMTPADKEQHLNVRFGRQFAPRLFISFAINSELSPGIFTNSKILNNYIWINAHYFTKNQRYGVTAYYYRNKLEMQENGGIVNDDLYTSHTESDNSVIPTNLTNATNLIKSSGAGIEHYFNLLPQTTKVSVEEPLPHPIDSLTIDSLRFTNDSIIDSIGIRYETKKRKFTLGRICHEFNYQRNQLFYNESSPSVAFYQPYDTLLNRSKTTDSTFVQAFRNTLKWNSLGYQKYNDDIPFFVYAGLTHGFYNVKSYDYIEDDHFGLPNRRFPNQRAMEAIHRHLKPELGPSHIRCRHQTPVSQLVRRKLLLQPFPLEQPIQSCHLPVFRPKIQIQKLLHRRQADQHRQYDLFWHRRPSNAIRRHVQHT